MVVTGTLRVWILRYPMSNLTTSRQLARTPARPRAGRLHAQTAQERAAGPDGHTPREISDPVWQELAKALYHKPHYALTLAQRLTRLAQERRDADARSRAELAGLRALNLCCAFNQAAAAGEKAARRFEKCRESGNAARAWLEAGWAHLFLGDYAAVHAALARINGAQTGENQIRRKWIEALLIEYQGDPQHAIPLYQEISAAWRARNDLPNAMRALRDEANATLRSDATRARELLTLVRNFFVETHAPLDVAWCDYISVKLLSEQNEFTAALAAANRLRNFFVRHNMPLCVGLCDMSRGLLHHYLSEYGTALKILTRAHRELLAQGALADASSCQLNIGVALTELHRYDEAVFHLQEVSERALALGQRTKYALCLVNLGWARSKQGRFVEALQYYARARSEYEQAKLPIQLAYFCDVNEGVVYLSLGQFVQARQVLERARAVLAREHVPAYLAECEMCLAQVYSSMGQHSAACRALEHARTVYQTETQQPAWVGVCNRQLASLAIRRGDFEQARVLLAEAEGIFRETGQPIELAMTDLVSAELALAQSKQERAAHLFRAARRRFGEALPDLAWRGEYGLGRVAEARARYTQALARYLNAIKMIAIVRGTLVTEAWSNTFFGARSSVYQDALRLTYAQGQPAMLLDIIEAAKARLLSVTLARHEWRSPKQRQHGRPDRAHTRLLKLQREILELEKKLMAQTRLDAAPGLRGGVETLSGTLNALQETRAHYEHTVSQIRVTQRGLEGAPVVDPFELEKFCAQAIKRWGTRWAGLVYYFYRGGLMIVTVEADRIRTKRMRLSAQERIWLSEYCNPDHQKRERYYRGTLHGFAVEGDITVGLSALTARLIPPWILERTDEPMLVISPHEQLHQLPFHALCDKHGYLLERFRFLYAPSLQVWTQLASAPTAAGDKMLVCGLEEFGNDIPPLPSVRAEVRGLKKLGGSKTRVLWDKDALRASLLKMNQAGALRDVNILHFATHAIVDMDAPHWSRILLADGHLSLADVLDLSLKARLVTLSGCSTAMGTGGAGDEWIALARAFFYAGAQTVVATQWAVEDNRATSGLMQEFYQQLERGCPIADALRGAQLRLMQNGKPPYLWAAYAVLGSG